MREEASEKAPAWAVGALLMQLVLTFFVPPIPLAGRSLFVGDLWCLAWLALALASDKGARRGVKFFAVSAAVVLVVWAHGHWRPSLLNEFQHGFYFDIAEGDAFKAGRELVVALRFLSWLWAARVVAGWSFGDRERRKLALGLAISLGVGGFIMMLDGLVPAFRLALGRVYQFNPYFEYWQARAHGTFRSPVEGGVALAFGAALLAARGLGLRPAVRWLAVALALLGVAFSKTLTCVVALAVAGVIAFRREIWWVARRHRAAAAASVAAVAGVVLYGIFHSERVSHKLHDLRFRLGPWGLYLEALSRRVDTALLGFGFAPYHIDNSYLFVLTRGGLVLFMLGAVYLARALAPHWRHWPSPSRLATAFLLVSATMLDVFIYRHVVALVLAAAIPLLSRSGKPSNRPAR